MDTKDENTLIKLRKEKLADIRAVKTAYPNKFRRDMLTSTIQEMFADTDKQSLEEKNFQVKVAGRIMLNRGAFLELQDRSGRIQLYVNRKELPKQLLIEIKQWDLGDIIGVAGVIHRSNKGDLYVSMTHAELLTKSLRPLPEKYKGLTDVEQCYRQRYIDLITNKKSQEVFKLRSQIIQQIRDYFIHQDFMEVETPMLQTIAGGATARPFITHHNALNIDMYLRIAPELYLKRLVVGGFEKVFEINRNFRNEGLSVKHNPEFTMIEFYQAYADYNDMMYHTEALFKQIVTKIFNSTTITYQGHEIDFSGPYLRMNMLDAIAMYNNDISISELSDLTKAREFAKTKGINVNNAWGIGKVQLEIFEETVEDKLIQPTFITDYPAEVSPLSRVKDDNPELTERFELFIAGREIANGFSELNDPEIQAQRFKEQVAAKTAGDDEAMLYDDDYIKALEYGLPPTAGEGIGIDRLVMLMTDSSSIKDVLLFPHMRPVD
jgi:lysyl-tRNA synthetase class 2